MVEGKTKNAQQPRKCWKEADECHVSSYQQMNASMPFQTSYQQQFWRLGRGNKIRKNWSSISQRKFKDKYMPNSWVTSNRSFHQDILQCDSKGNQWWSTFKELMSYSGTSFSKGVCSYESNHSKTTNLRDIVYPMMLVLPNKPPENSQNTHLLPLRGRSHSSHTPRAILQLGKTIYCNTFFSLCQLSQMHFNPP